jgi:phospholipase D1/2
VGLARTLPAMDDPAAAAVDELRALHLAAIAAARRCIYIENQTFSSEAVFTALIARLGRPTDPPLEVVIVLPQRTTAVKERIAMGVRQDRLIEALTAAAHRSGHHLGVYCSVAPCPEGGEDRQVYVHAKLMIVDDRFLLVGSANTTNRSMGLDSELGLAWECEAPAPSLRAARVELLRDHTGLPRATAEELLLEPGGLVARLERLVSTGARLRHQPREEGERRGDLLGKLLPDGIAIDPDGPVMPGSLRRASMSGLTTMWRWFKRRLGGGRAPLRD